MCTTSFVIFLTTNPYINWKTASNSSSNSLCCTVHLCVFFYCTVYLHKMPRRNRIPIGHRERIVRAFEDEAEDYLLVADTLGENRSTARGIVAPYITEGSIRERPRGGRNNVLVDDEMRQCLEDIINENCVLTLSQINGELRRRLPAKLLIYDRTVARNLRPLGRHCNTWDLLFIFVRLKEVDRNTGNEKLESVKTVSYFHPYVKRF